MASTKMSKSVRKKLQDRDESTTYDSKNLTVAEYVDRWLESTQDTVGLRTYQRSESSAKLHLVPTLGRVKLEKLTAMQLDKLYREKLKAGLSPRSAQIIRATAHKMLKQAVRWNLVRHNVAANATPPKTVRQEMHPLTKLDFSHS